MNAETINPRNVFLIGYRCTGKSSVGKLLAAKLGWQFIDTDLRLISDSGQSIKEIVKIHGWQTFRKMEQAIIEQVCTINRRIVATGGGVVLNDANVESMKAAGKIVWLRAAPETIRRRMMRDTDTEAFRPALTSKDSIAEIEETLLERGPYYRRTMDFSVDTDDRRVDEVCEAIMQQLIAPDADLIEKKST